MKKTKEFCYLWLLTVINTSVSGFVFLKLFNWIIAPVFNTSFIVFLEAVGTVIVFNFLYYKKPKASDKITMMELTEDCGQQIVFSFVTMLLGWIVSLFI